MGRGRPWCSNLLDNDKDDKNKIKMMMVMMIQMIIMKER